MNIGARLHAVEQAMKRRDLGTAERPRLCWPAAAAASGAPAWEEWDGRGYVACDPPGPDAIVLRWPNELEEAGA